LHDICIAILSFLKATTMTDSADTTQTALDASQLQTAPFDRDALFRESLEAFAYLERRHDAARKRLERTKRAEDFLAYLIVSKRGLIGKLLGMWFTPNDIADMLLEKITSVSVSRKKILAAIQKCRPETTTQDENSLQKRRGRPPKNTVTDTTDTAQQSELDTTDSENSEKIPGTKTGNSPKNSRNISENFPQTSEKSSTQSTKNRTQTSISSPKKDASLSVVTAPATGLSSEKQNSEERQQRLRRKAPSWVNEYSDDPKYGPIVMRRNGENDSDYYWRMWHTAPPWANEQPRIPDESETQWIQKCWLLTSPEERAAHEASLPTTAR